MPRKNGENDNEYRSRVIDPMDFCAAKWLNATILVTEAQQVAITHII